MRRARFFPRPLALSRSAMELPAAAALVAVLLVMFAGDLTEPPRRVIGIADVIPILAAVWLLSTPLALLVSAVGFVLLVLTGVTGVVDWVTVGIEVGTFLLVAVVARLYAESLLEVLTFRRGRRTTPIAADSGEPIPSLARDLPHGLPTLSQREREVARLAADGLTARQIGDRLFIGERTVETHLGHVYEKLGIGSRLDLVKLASRQRL